MPEYSKTYEKIWNEFRQYIIDYEANRLQSAIYKSDDYFNGRYCVSLSCEDILKIMDNMESKNGVK